jgi:hypothetical protein
MTVNRTTLLDLPLPVTGTESGTWGDTTNNGLTQYLDIAIAGMSNLTSANFTTGAVTIETTEGDSSVTNILATSAQYAGFRVTSLAQNSTITVGNTGTNPARSYRLINADATYTLTFKATGQTGVTLLPGQSAVVAFNGTDYVIVGMVGAGTATDNAVARFDGTTGEILQSSGVTIDDSNNVSGVAQLNATTVDATNVEVTNIKAKDGTAAATIADSTGVVTVTAAPVMTALTASQAVFTTAGKALTSNAITGTGNVVMSASPTLTGTIAGASLQLSSLTSGRVTYATTSGLLTDSANLLYSGTDLTVYGLTVGRGAGAVASNTAVGASALAANTTGANNTATGNQALVGNTTGDSNSAFGYFALRGNTTGTVNTAVALGALQQNTTGAANTAIGTQALTSNTTASNNTAVGYQAGYSNTTGGTISAFGAGALYSATTAADCTAFGWYSLNSVTTGSANSGFGDQTLRFTTTGVSNAAMGNYALRNNSTGSQNTAMGREALYSNTTASYNTAVGYQALYSNVTGVENAAFGFRALDVNIGSYNNAFGSETLGANTSGANNTAFGHAALGSNTTASNNTAVGYQAGYANITGTKLVALGMRALATSTGDGNVAVGYKAQELTSSGGSNTAIGDVSLANNSTGSYNTALGAQALISNTTASNNTAVGYQAGDVITTGARNTIIGDGSDPSANNGNDQTVVGQGLTGKGDDTAFIGGTNGAYNEKNVTTWETTSDERIKKNIVDNTVGLEKIKQIRVRNFEYRKPEEITELPDHAAINKDGVQLGVIAQEIQQVLPECVTENSTGVLSVSTDPLVWHLINAVKQLSAEVESLKSQLKGN